MNKGKTYRYDDKFKAKARKHQFDFRENELNDSYDEKNPQVILTPGAAKKGLIFCDTYRDLIRNEIKSFSANALCSNMLRSEHIPYNIFTPMWEDRDAMVLLFNEIIGGGISAITKIKIEFAGNTDINEYLLAGIQEQVVNSHPVFREYSKVVLGLDPKYYINAGIILMNLKKFREYKIEDKFIHLINTYNFDTIAPDQDYLNLLCAGLIKYMPNGWNKESLPLDLEGNLNLVHYALYKKPWQHDNVLNGEHFWHYAEKSPFYNTILNKKQNFTAEDLARKEKANVQIVNDAITLTNSSFSFYSTLLKSERENLNSGKTTVQNVLKQFFINAGVLDGKKCG